MNSHTTWLIHVVSKGLLLPFTFQEAALGCITLIKEYLDDKIMKNMVLPRAKSLYNKSENIKVILARRF